MNQIFIHITISWFIHAYYLTIRPHYFTLSQNVSVEANDPPRIQNLSDIICCKSSSNTNINKIFSVQNLLYFSNRYESLILINLYSLFLSSGRADAIMMLRPENVVWLQHTQFVTLNNI